MPPVRSSRTRKPPPPGFTDIEDTLLSYANKMRDAENAPHTGKARHEVLWPIFQIAHARSRYIYDLYYNKGNEDGGSSAISKQLYDWLLKNGYADASLIAKWKKQGYEKLCCLRCIQTSETNFGASCICRVPKAALAKKTQKGKKDGDDEGEDGERGGGAAAAAAGVQCVNCGCRGCASSD